MATEGGIENKQNLFTALYSFIKFITSTVIKIVEYILYFVYLICDYAISFACAIMSIGFVQHTPFPMKLLMYVFVAIRAICIIYGFRLLFVIIFQDFINKIFTRSNTSQCEGNVLGTDGSMLKGLDNDTMCVTARYIGENYLTGEKTFVTYNYNKVNNANLICLKQLIQWFVFLNLFTIPATITSI